jgi:hypothetical protein
MRAFDKQTADRAGWKEDPEIDKAVQSLPKAKELIGQAQRVLATFRRKILRPGTDPGGARQGCSDAKTPSEAITSEGIS